MQNILSVATGVRLNAVLSVPQSLIVMHKTEKQKHSHAWQCRFTASIACEDRGLETNGGDTVVQTFSLTNELRPGGSERTGGILHDVTIESVS